MADEAVAAAKPISPLIKIAAPKAEQEANKKFLKDMQAQADDPGFVSERNKDMFFGGPHDGLVCDHQPNGPRSPDDPKGYWADYYFFDKMYLPEFFGKMPGYHLYSCIRLPRSAGTHVAKGHDTTGGFGVRCKNMRKRYTYIGFLSPALLAADGISPSEFHGVLTIG